MIAFLTLVVSAPTTSHRQLAEVAPVNIGIAGDFAILSKTGISTVPESAITGDIGVSPGVPRPRVFSHDLHRRYHQHRHRPIV